ncbi:hypothetical protein [Ascidiimonas aurantiaca]|uniref:hypothetical protein n=1 Tax=Ascidiimonas aurantiaca TaxID=1685432 RepID=UPI0030EF3A07
MKKNILISLFLSLTYSVNAQQWNPNGDNTTSGAVITQNPNNTAANSAFSWYNNTARIRIGGTGNGIENGFLIQGVGEKKLFEVNDGFARVFNPNNREANITLSWLNNIARLRIGGSGIGAENGFEIQSTNEKKLLKLTHSGNLAIYGKIEAKEVKVSLTPTADFVFENNYNLPTLEFIENYIKEKKHLPEIASAKEMEKNGVNIGTFQIQLLQKIEELTLYTIQQEKKIKEQAQKIEDLESLNNKLLELQSRLEKLESEK